MPNVPVGRLEPYVMLMVDKTDVDAEILRRVTGVSIHGKSGAATTAKVVFNDETGALADLAIYAKGVEWSILLGWRTDFVPFGPFGVSGYGMECGSDGIIKITVDLQDDSRRLMRKAKYRSWEGRALGDVVAAIAEEHGLGYRIDSSELVVYDEDNALLQAGEPDATFLARLARRHGFRLEFDQGHIVFRQKQTTDDVEGVRTLAWRIGDRSLLRFAPKQRSYGGKGKAVGTVQAGAKIVGANVDILAGTDFEFSVSTDALLPELAGGGECLEEGGEVTPSADVEGANREWVMDGETGELVEVQEQEEAEVPLRDVEGAEIPDTAEAVNKAAAAAIAGGRSDSADATGELAIADCTWKTGDEVEIVGVPVRFEGRWRVVDWKHDWTPSGLKTVLGFGKKGLGASSKTADAVDAALDPEAASRTSQPEFERVWNMDPETGELVATDREKE